MPVSIVIPAYNEEKAIKSLLESVKRSVSKSDEIILVNDGSKDRTFERAKAVKGIKIISYTPNRGKANALKTGIAEAKNDIIVTLDSDWNHPPQEIPKLVRALGDYDIVVGSRFLRGLLPENVSIQRGVANVFGSLVTSIILGKRVTDLTCGMRIFRKSKVRKILPLIKAKNLDFEAEFTSRAIRGGLKYGETPITTNKRIGDSHLRFIRCLFIFLIAVIRGRFL